MQATLTPTLWRGSVRFADASQATAGKRHHSSPIAAFNRAEAYPDTLYTGTGEKTSEVLAGDVAGTLNFLDITEGCPGNVAFLSKCDLFSDDRSSLGEKRSGKRCRFYCG